MTASGIRLKAAASAFALTIFTLAVFDSAAWASSQEQVIPAGMIEDIGAADRIEAGDRLRTLTQVLASAACYLNADVDAKANRGLLRKGIPEVDQIIDALMHGDARKGIIGAESQHQMLNKLNMFSQVWADVKPAFTAVLDDPSDVVALNQIYDKTTPFLEQASVLLVGLEGAYGNPAELLQSDMFLLDIAGRQAMSAQRMSYEACRIWSGVATAQDKDELRNLTSQFEFALGALLNGAPNLGVPAAPTPDIATALQEAASDWSDIKWKLDELADSGSISPKDATKMCRVLYGKMAKMEKVTHLYAEYSRRVY